MDLGTKSVTIDYSDRMTLKFALAMYARRIIREMDKMRNETFGDKSETTPEIFRVCRLLRAIGDAYTSNVIRHEYYSVCRTVDWKRKNRIVY